MELRAFPPQIMTAADLVGVAVPALAAGVPGAAATVNVKWARPEFVEGVLVVPNGDVLGVREEMAKLSLELVDSMQREVITDGRAQTVGLVLPFGFPALSMGGMGIRPFALQRPVSPGDVWKLTISNRHTAPLTLAGVLFFLRRPMR